MIGCVLSQVDAVLRGPRLARSDGCETGLRRADRTPGAQDDPWGLTCRSMRPAGCGCPRRRVTAVQICQRRSVNAVGAPRAPPMELFELSEMEHCTTAHHAGARARGKAAASTACSSRTWSPGGGSLHRTLPCRSGHRLAVADITDVARATSRLLCRGTCGAEPRSVAARTATRSTMAGPVRRAWTSPASLTQRPLRATARDDDARAHSGRRRLHRGRLKAHQRQSERRAARTSGWHRHRTITAILHVISCPLLGIAVAARIVDESQRACP